MWRFPSRRAARTWQRIIGIALANLFGLTLCEALPLWVCLRLDSWIGENAVPTIVLCRGDSTGVQPLFSSMIGSLGELYIDPLGLLGGLLLLQGVLVCVIQTAQYGRLLHARSLLSQWWMVMPWWWLVAFIASMPAAILYNSPTLMNGRRNASCARTAYFLVCLLAFAVLVARRSRKLRRRAARVYGRCMHCGYLLKGVLGRTCPECGKERR